MDALSDVLQVSRLTGGVFLYAEFGAPWCLRGQLAAGFCAPYVGPAAHLVFYHYVVDGRMRIRVDRAGEPEYVAGPGDVVLLTHNDPHLLGSDLAQPPVFAAELIRPAEGAGLATIQAGGQGPRTTLICGFLGCEPGDGNPLLATLPPVLVLDVNTSGAADWIRSTFRYAADEVAAGRPGSATVLSKLSELLFVEAVRHYVESLPPEQTGWLAGLRDRHVGRALALFHGEPARAWTLDELGREAGLSRSALTERFTRLLGVAPMQYLGNWRMQLAAQKLRATRAPLAAIAAEVGYESEAAFSRAFKRAFGTAPATWRRGQ